MRIINETHWRTDHLRAFISRVAQDELNPKQRKRLVITVVYTRGRHHSSSGYAYYHSNIARVRLPSEGPDKIDFAHVIAHELAHTRGMKHRAMTGDPRYDRMPRTREIYAWAADLPLEKKVVAPKQRPGHEEKLAHAQQMLNLNASKMKRYATICKKWRRRVKYYEGQMALAAARKENI